MTSSLLMCLMSFLHVFLLLGGVLGSRIAETSFGQNYEIYWGYDHVSLLNQGREIQLSLDKSSGSGFQSKESFGSGFFHMMIKLPGKDSAGVVTAFYLTSLGNNHDELDFEFLGNKEGKPILLQTNVFANGQLGNREQRILLWFDPSADFHTYKILWNQHQIVFYVEDVPIRVFKNCTNVGVSYPSQPMQIRGSLWDGSNWATDGGQTKVNWSYAPFQARFQGFDIEACPAENSSTIQPCYSPRYSWNTEQFWKLDSNQQRTYENVRQNYLTYDYCSDRARFPVAPPECAFNN